MERVRGVITSPNGEVILEDVEMYIHETRGGGRRGWLGGFSVPSMARIETDTYHLALEDGREATIMVNDVRHRREERAGDHTAVTFLVSGLLAQPA